MCAQHELSRREWADGEASDEGNRKAAKLAVTENLGVVSNKQDTCVRYDRGAATLLNWVAATRSNGARK